MPRLHQVRRNETDSPLVHAMYDYVFGDRDPVDEPGTATGSRGDWWPTFANSPDVLAHAVGGSQLYRSTERVLDPILRELSQARIGWACGSQFVFSQHCHSLHDLGETDERINAIAHWPAASCFTDVERLVLAYTDCLAYDRGRVPDAMFDALKAALGDVALLELSYIATLYLQHAVLSRALRTEFDDVDERVVEVPKPSNA